VPEILEVESARALIDARALHRPIVGVHAPDEWFLKRGLTPRAVTDVLTGNELVTARRRGKLMLIDTREGAVVGLHLFLRDPRRLGAVELDPDEDRLGPDAFALTLPELRAITAKSRAPIKAVLMDQSRIAGLGNLLCDEALWRAGVDPARLANTLDADATRRLHRAIRDTLRVLGRRGGSHTGDLTSQREPGAHCPKDGAPLLRRTVGGRTTYSCPVHQL
jgi:formamidopyrimidine-DNA glycosylase